MTPFVRNSTSSPLIRQAGPHPSGAPGVGVVDDFAYGGVIYQGHVARFFGNDERAGVGAVVAAVGASRGGTGCGTGSYRVCPG